MIDTHSISTRLKTMCIMDETLCIHVNKIDFNLVNIRMERNKIIPKGIDSVVYDLEEVPCFFSVCLRYCKEFSDEGLINLVVSDDDKFTIMKKQ